ncbi:GNAT family N-acetyltransferase [Ornithinimicrobium tianjinense]|uniref:N-acetyltransferase domain-containing protein n=1 Tax=Ornithinimicrobium tianjinense TaxID=1195761 RepID=A0A917F4R4_9MICO|nr:GNAT family N-acetyltransferase [Ornithinimicrobium tianjinense]GGF52422.1 hypothetical protein GCM10011366_20310 [Ornithinimicrobium tianjinense]
MTITKHTPGTEELPTVLAALRGWQGDQAPAALHPGDVGWFWRFGERTVAASVRLWRRDDQILAVGLVDGARLLRVNVAPDVFADEELAQAVAVDAADPGRGLLPEGEATVDAPSGSAVSAALRADGWSEGERWTPLRRDLGGPVEDPEVAVTVTVVRPDRPGDVADRVAVQRSAFARSTFTEERWHLMAAGPAYDSARCLLARDPSGAAVAAITVWSAGPGLPGLVEPMGVHPDHRGRGYGRAITLAGAAALRELGSSSALVCAESSNAAAVATYAAAGCVPQPEIVDLCRG